MNCNSLVAVLTLVFTRPAWCAERSPMKITEDAIAVAKGSNEFATDLYARLRSDKPTNLFFSPYSISVALAMADAGAAGETEAQIARVLHLSVPEPRVHSAFSTLQKLLVPNDKTPDFQLRIANRLWGQKDFQFQPAFLDVTKTNYGADLGLLDFNQSDAARKTINSWIEEQTDNKIQDLIAAGVLNAHTRLVLTNAIYFKARWTHEFGKGATIDAPFHTSESKQMVVPTMHKVTGFKGDLILAMQKGLQQFAASPLCFSRCESRESNPDALRHWILSPVSDFRNDQGHQEIRDDGTGEVPTVVPSKPGVVIGGELPADLALIVEVWARLPAAIKAGIVAMVQATRGAD
jgi:Serpin (serine protease inhibitor)